MISLCCLTLQNSPDLKAAREVADFLGTIHHEFHFTVQVKESKRNDFI
jgi:asparagine synthase (glutamine-hydrolysing)